MALVPSAGSPSPPSVACWSPVTAVTCRLCSCLVHVRLHTRLSHTLAPCAPFPLVLLPDFLGSCPSGQM